MLSLNNNLLLHRNYDPKKDLVPKKISHQLKEIELEIKQKQARSEKVEVKERADWYENILKEGEPLREKKFQF